MDSTSPKIIPCLRYADAPAAIDFLCEAFGFERQMVVPGEDGEIAHAQLGCPGGMIMVGSATDDDFGRVCRPPSATGGINTQSAYVVVEDVDKHYARAKAAGAKIIFELEVKDYGGKGYGCADLEGNIWSFGDYDPYATEAANAQP